MFDKEIIPMREPNLMSVQPTQFRPLAPQFQSVVPTATPVMSQFIPQPMNIQGSIMPRMMAPPVTQPIMQPLMQPLMQPRQMMMSSIAPMPMPMAYSQVQMPQVQVPMMQQVVRPPVQQVMQPLVQPVVQPLPPAPPVEREFEYMPYEKTVIEYVPKEKEEQVPVKSIEYVPVEQTKTEYEAEETTEYVPVKKINYKPVEKKYTAFMPKEKTDYVTQKTVEYVPVEKKVTDYYPIEHQIEYVPQVSYVPTKRSYVHPTPITSEIPSGIQAKPLDKKFEPLKYEPIAKIEKPLEKKPEFKPLDKELKL